MITRHLVTDKLGVVGRERNAVRKRKWVKEKTIIIRPLNRRGLVLWPFVQTRDWVSVEGSASHPQRTEVQGRIVSRHVELKDCTVTIFSFSQ